MTSTPNKTPETKVNNFQRTINSIPSMSIHPQLIPMCLERNKFEPLWKYSSINQFRIAIPLNGYYYRPKRFPPPLTCFHHVSENVDIAGWNVNQVRFRAAGDCWAVFRPRYKMELSIVARESRVSEAFALSFAFWRRVTVMRDLRGARWGVTVVWWWASTIWNKKRNLID